MKFSLLSWLKKLPKPERYLVLAFSIALLVSFIALLLDAFVQGTIQAPAFGGSIRGGFIGTPHYINPVFAPANEIDRALVKLLYPSLLRYTQEGKFEPYLAKHFAIGDQGKVYDFFLQEGAVWDDGKPVNAHDVVFTIKTIQDPKISSPIGRLWEGVKVEALDDLTIRFTLPEPYAFFLQNVTTEILPRHIWSQISPENFALSEYNKKPVGAGPYSFVNFTKSDSEITAISFKANPSFFGKPPYIPKLTIRFYLNTEGLFKAYQKGEIDFSPLPMGSSFPPEITNEAGTITAFPLPRYFALFLNEKSNPALAKKAVREALLVAIDRDTLISSVLNNQAQKVYSPIPPILSEYYNPGLSRYDFDLERAKDLLQTSNFSEKKPLKIELSVVSDDSLSKVGHMIAAYWKAAGIEVTIKTRQLSELRDQLLQERSYEIFLFGQALALQPDPFSLWHSSQGEYPGLNLTSYKNPELDKLLEELRQNFDASRQKELFGKFQEIIVRDLPALFLYSPYYLVFTNDSIKGVASRPLSLPEEYINQIPEWYIYTKRASK